VLFFTECVSLSVVSFALRRKKRCFKYIRNPGLCVFFLLSITFFLVLFMRGAVHMTLINPDQVLVKCLFYTTASFFVMGSRSIEIKKKYLLFTFLSGMFLYSITVILYSYFLDSTTFGYRHLFNPFIDDFVSSTNYSNNIALIFCGAVIAFCIEKKWGLNFFQSL
jgi:hypothetical protein